MMADMVVQEATQEKLITAAEFASLPNDGKKYELVKGKLVEVCRPKFEHGQLQVKLSRYLDVYLDDNPIGYVTVESGYVTSTNPDSVRGPDVAFISSARYPNPVASEYPPVAPELVIEIVSPGETQSDVDEKIDDYLAAGTLLIWLFYPKAKAVHIFRPDGEPDALNIDGVLDGEDVLPGFRLPLREVFKGLTYEKQEKQAKKDNAE